MKRLALSVAAALTALVTVASVPAMAAGGDYQHNRNGWHRPAPVLGHGVQRQRTGFGFEIVIGNPGVHYRPAPRHYQPRYMPRRTMKVVPRAHARGIVRAHFQWCASRYRSYRTWDNTFQPHHGARRACVSPYGGR